MARGITAGKTEIVPDLSAATSAERQCEPELGTAKAQIEATAHVYVYIGPSIPRGRLKENTVFKGTREAVWAHLSALIAEYPRIGTLIVPTELLAMSKQKIKAGGNLVGNAYRELTSAFETKEA